MRQNDITAYPLSWPDGYPRSKRPGGSQFKTSLSGALKNVNKSLDMFAKDSNKKIENIVISSNVTLGKQRPEDAGVVVYFSWNGISTCFPVDLYSKCEDNLQAIYHCIEADRTKLRHGGIGMITAAYRGQAALPPGTGDTANWREIFGVPGTFTKTASLAAVEKRYRQLSSKYHPDHGGNTDEFDLITKARDIARKELS